MKLTKSKLKQIIKEEISLFAGLEVENNFIKKNNLTEGGNIDFNELVATWKMNPSTSSGNPQWSKRHGIRKAFVTPEQDRGVWRWVVFEFNRDGDEDDIAQGTAASYEEAIMTADKALISAR